MDNLKKKCIFVFVSEIILKTKKKKKMFSFCLFLFSRGVWGNKLGEYDERFLVID